MFFIIYKHTCSISNKSYIGYTSQSIDERFADHLKESKRGSKTHFHKALRKYGVESFICEIIASTWDETNAKFLETHFIDEFDTFNNGYNMTRGGSGGNTFSKMTKDEVKEINTRAAKTRQTKIEEIGLKISESHLSKTKEEKDLANQKRQITMSQITSTGLTKKELSKIKEIETKNNWTEEQKQEIFNKISVKIKERNSNYTQADWDKIIKKRSEAWNKKSKEEIEEIYTKQKESLSEYFSNLDKNGKLERKERAKYARSKSPGHIKKCMVNFIVFNDMKTAEKETGVSLYLIRKKIKDCVDGYSFI
jgi:group I intron endonuclease